MAQGQDDDVLEQSFERSLTPAAGSGEFGEKELQCRMKWGHLAKGKHHNLGERQSQRGSSLLANLHSRA